MQMRPTEPLVHSLDKLKYKLDLHSGAQKTCSCCMRFYSMQRMFLSEWREDGYFGHLLCNESIKDTLGTKPTFSTHLKYDMFSLLPRFISDLQLPMYSTLPIIDIVRPTIKDIRRRWLRGRNRKQLNLLFPPIQNDRHSSTFEGLKLYQMFVLTNSCTCSFWSHILDYPSIRLVPNNSEIFNHNC
jgi:hypothetical protein